MLQKDKNKQYKYSNLSHIVTNLAKGHYNPQVFPTREVFSKTAPKLSNLINISKQCLINPIKQYTLQISNANKEPIHK